MELDYTQLTTYQACPMKYYLKFVLGLKKKVVDVREIDKLFGQAVHKGLEVYYNNVCRGKHNVVEVLKVFDDFVDLPPEAKEFHKTKQNGIDLLIKYMEHYSFLDKDMRILESGGSKRGVDFKFLKNEYEKKRRRTKLIKALGGWRKAW